MEYTGTGGRLQSPVPTRGDVDWAAATTLFTVATSVVAKAFQLVASGINLKSNETPLHYITMFLSAFF